MGPVVIKRQQEDPGSCKERVLALDSAAGVGEVDELVQVGHTSQE